MSTLSARRKAMRGTKRTCQACEVRFYDLARSPIVCPIMRSALRAAGGPVVHSSAPFCTLLQQDGMAQPAVQANSTDTAG